MCRFLDLFWFSWAYFQAVALLLAFVFDWGRIGAWWAYLISIFISAIALSLWFMAGRWKKAHHLRKEDIPEVVA